MPGRRKPTSTRQKKEEQKLKRAIKRGDVPAPDPKPLNRTKPGRLRGDAAKLRATQVDSVRRLQSAFVKLPPKFLEETKLVASTVPLDRPIHSHSVILDTRQVAEDLPRLTCPRRPKWRFDMSKKEVEHNEEGLFKKWLEQMDECFQAWQESDAILFGQQASTKSPSYFERNLEVWRQLWRVSEISQILLVLLDSRFPLVHYPPSLEDYLAKRKVIFVLTKVDITGPVCTKTWIEHLGTRYPGTRIVQVKSYVEKRNTADQGHAKFEPHIPDDFRNQLVNAIKAAHSELLEPPADVQTNPSRLVAWKPSVKREIDWDLLKSAMAREDRPDNTRSPPQNSQQIDDERDELEYLTVGLIGQPNVGKSSLLNALFGQPKVKASRTPGKTKHFQTLFWSSEIRLVDCPGLVMPQYIPMELQVLCGILPISRISAVPACIHFVGSLLPLERILKLSHPNESSELTEDKRTWRDGMVPTTGTSKPRTWTAMEVLVAHANAKGWVTAKAARPDIHRSVLRLLAEGRIGWAFWPPRADKTMITEENGEGNGIWIPRFSILDERSDGSEQHEQVEDSESEEAEGGEEEVDDSSEGSSGADESVLQSTSGRFEALGIDDEGTEDETND